MAKRPSDPRNKIGGLPVVNATEKVDLNITAGDIRRGDMKDPGGCAAAVACRRQMHAVDARVHIARTYIKLDKKWIRYLTPFALRTEIIAFDRGAQFTPGEYTLLPMPKPQKKSARKAPSGKSRQKRVFHTQSGIRPHGANR